jgi:hypothetical protein
MAIKVAAEFKKISKDMSKSWNAMKERAKEMTFEGIPAGTYHAIPTDGEINISQNGRLQCMIEYTITEGEYEDRTVRSYDGLDNDGVAYFLKRIENMGYSFNELEFNEIPQLIEAILSEKPVLRIKVKYKGDSTFPSVTVLGTVDFSPVEEKSKTKATETEPKSTSEKTEPEPEDSDEEDEEETEEETEEEESEEEETEEDTEEEIELEEGMNCAYRSKKDNGKRVEGVIKTVDGDNGVVKVKRNDTGKIATVDPSDESVEFEIL